MTKIQNTFNLDTQNYNILGAFYKAIQCPNVSKTTNFRLFQTESVCMQKNNFKFVEMAESSKNR